MNRTATVRRAQEGATSRTGLFEKGGGHQQDEHRAQPEQRTSGHHSQAAAGIRRGSGNGEELADDGGDEDAERNRGEDISRELKRIDGGKIGLNEADVIKQAVLRERTRRERSAIWGTMMSHLIHGWRMSVRERTGK